MQTTPIDRKQRSRHRTTGHCLQTIQAKTSETQNISMEKSRYLQDKGRSRIIGFSSFLMSFLLPVDLSPDGCIDPRMCVSPLCHFRRYKDNTLDLMLLSHPAYKLRCKPLPSIGNSDHDKDVSAVFFFDGAYFFFDLV
jgi:hypothetical protein